MLLGGSLLALLAFSAVADDVSSGLHDRVGAFRIISHGVVARVTRVNSHNLHYTRPAPDSATEKCTVMLLGDVLTVKTTHQPHNHFSYIDCNVTFRSVESRCWASTYMVNGPADATIAGLGLTEAEMGSIHREHFLASWSEDTWFKVIMLSAIVLAVSVTLAGCVCLAAWSKPDGLRVQQSRLSQL